MAASRDLIEGWNDAVWTFCVIIPESIAPFRLDFSLTFVYQGQHHLPGYRETVESLGRGVRSNFTHHQHREPRRWSTNDIRCTPTELPNYCFLRLSSIGMHEDPLAVTNAPSEKKGDSNPRTRAIRSQQVRHANLLWSVWHAYLYLRFSSRQRLRSIQGGTGEDRVL